MSKLGPKSFEYCECERTQELLAIEESPVKYNPDTKEFTVEFESLDGTTKYFIVFCFFCGGRLPARQIEPPYENISDEEVNKLKSIINDCSSIPEVIAKNGEPDSCFNTVTYTKLSKKAWVQVVENPGKPLGVVVSKKRTSRNNENT